MLSHANGTSNVNALNAGIEKPMTNDCESGNQRPGVNFNFNQKRPIQALCTDRSHTAIRCITAAEYLETAAATLVYEQGKAEASSRCSGGNYIKVPPSLR
jgi:hypothetical protein